jgi:hypothetical protein
LIAAGIFLAAMAVRMYFLFNVSDPQNAGEAWYDDTYHHWQVAYLTREIGLGKGFLRLWDLKGMEYFWGPLHPLLMMASMAISGSVSIVNARMISIIFGSLVIATLYLLIKKLWNRQTGLATAFLAMIHPVAILNDSSGMLEPIGWWLLLVGMLILDRLPLVAGAVWGLAATARAEDWMFGGLLLILAVKAVKPAKLPMLFTGYIVTVFVYMKYLLDKTGNPIYPVWWNYLANARGVWSDETAVNAYQAMVKPYLVGWFAVSVVLLGLAVWKAKGGKKLFLSLGLANWAFIGGFMGLTHYLKGFEPWFWYIRFFEFPYIFLGFLICLGLFYWAGKQVPMLTKMPGKLLLWLPVVLLGLAVQVAFWPPILARYDETRPVWARSTTWANQLIKGYGGGKIWFPDGYAEILYHLVYEHGVEGKQIVGQMFDPYYYMEGDPYANWGENRMMALNWIKDEDIKYLITEQNRQRYQELVKREPQLFEKVGGAGPLMAWRVYPERAKP